VLQPESSANDGRANVAASASAMKRFMSSPFVVWSICASRCRGQAAPCSCSRRATKKKR
jgi:hypothetical protein